MHEEFQIPLSIKLKAFYQVSNTKSKKLNYKETNKIKKT